MAGQQGAFAEAMLKNPQFQEQLGQWNALFGNTKAGVGFMANPPPNPHEMRAQQSAQAQQMAAKEGARQ